MAAGRRSVWRRSAALALLLCCGTAGASLEHDGTWKGGVWSPTVWASGVWLEVPTIAVPDVIGMTASAADAALEGVGLDTGAVGNVCSTETVGLVVSQAPPAGALVAEGSAVAISLSTGVACKGAGGRLKLHLDLRLQQ